MAEIGYLNRTREADIERSTAEIRQDIAKKEEKISQTVGQIGDRIKEKLDWRGYVNDYPYWVLGGAAGLGYLASRMFKKKPTPRERIMDSIAGIGRDALGSVAGSAAPGVIKAVLLGIATKAATNWIKNATSTRVAGGAAGPQPQGGSAVRSTGDTQNIIKSES